jgi:transposase InsO family protein
MRAHLEAESGIAVVAVLVDASRKVLSLGAPASYSPAGAVQLLQECMTEVGERPLCGLDGQPGNVLARAHWGQIGKLKRLWDAFDVKTRGTSCADWRLGYNKRPHSALPRSTSPNLRYAGLPHCSAAEGPRWKVQGETVPFPQNLEKADRTVVLN